MWSVGVGVGYVACVGGGDGVVYAASMGGVRVVLSVEACMVAWVSMAG